MEHSKKWDYEGKENKISAEHLLNGETIKLTGYGNSMTPIIKSGQSVLVSPISKDTILSKNDVVFCKVNGHYYLHKISAVKNSNSYQISNNHGHVNGTISRRNIFGKLKEIL